MERFLIHTCAVFPDVSAGMRHVDGMNDSGTPVCKAYHVWDHTHLVRSGRWVDFRQQGGEGLDS